MAKKKDPALLDLAVSFGNLNVGDKTCRIGAQIARRELSLSQADKNLCDKRLSGHIIAKPAGWSADQGALAGMGDDTELSGVFDVKGINVSSDHIGIGLTFARASVDVASLADFAKREGRLVIQGVEELPEESNGEAEE